MGLKRIPSGICDIVIADPPYNIGKDFGNNDDKKSIEHYVNWSDEWINECIRIMKPQATMFIYGFSEILAYLSVKISLEKRWLIWHYTNKNVATLNFWQRSHEGIICCCKEKPIFNRDYVREPYTAGFLNGAAGKTRKNTIGRFSKGGKYTIGNHFTEINSIPSVINLEPVYSSEVNKQRGFRGGALRKLYTNDEHKYFFADFVKCSKFSCLSLTRDRSEKQIADYYRNTDGIELKNLSWIGYDSIRKIIDKYNLKWVGAHLEMNKRHFGLY